MGIGAPGRRPDHRDAEHRLDSLLLALPDRLGHFAGLAERLTATAPDDLRRRPDPEVWSAIEYACHVRDVLLVMRERVLLILRSSSPPAIATMGRDERVVHDRYREQAPADVSRQLLDAAAMLVRLFDGIDDELWDLTCIYGYPEPAERTLAWVAQHVVHEAEHHLTDLVESLGAR